MKTSSPLPRTSRTTELVLRPAQFQLLRDLLATYSGVFLDEARQRVLTDGLSKRLAATRLNFDAYIDLVRQPAERAELQQLAELVLNHETVFFRNAPHMHALRKEILPGLHQQKAPDEPLRIWSAGCATGEEPYSLAIQVLETLGPALTRPVEIWATDLSEAALNRARHGQYRGRTLANVNPELRTRYFTHAGDTWTVRQSVRTLVHFEQLNLLEPFPAHAQDLDLIFCQNVTIYFQLETCRQLMQRFYTTLPNGGMLFLGFSETLWNIFDKFQSREIAGAFIYYKESYPAPAPICARLPSGRRSEPRQAPVSASNRASLRAPYPPARRASAAMPEQQRSASDNAAPFQAVEPAHVAQAGQLLDAGKAGAALAVLHAVPLDGPQAPQLVALAARAHANRGDLDLAVAEARRAIELDPLTAEAYLLLGILYAQQHEWPAAIAQLERARYLEPTAALVSFHLAEVYRQGQRPNLAGREYRNTLRKLELLPADRLLDGAAVGWIRETCQRYLAILPGGEH